MKEIRIFKTEYLGDDEFVVNLIKKFGFKPLFLQKCGKVNHLYFYGHEDKEKINQYLEELKKHKDVYIEFFGLLKVHTLEVYDEYCDLTLFVPKQKLKNILNKYLGRKNWRWK